jgi:hypothetical protein
MLHLGHALSATHFRDDPFPHFVVANALPEPRYRELASRLPSDELIRQGAAPGDNRRFSWSARETLIDPRLDPVWRDFIAAHVSQAFLDAVLAAFAPAIRTRYPWLEERMGPTEGWRVGVRRRDGFDSAEVLVDTQICLNSPVIAGASAVRGPHVDKPDKLFAGLFYMRPADDHETRGGELQIQRYRDRSARFDGSQLPPTAVATAHQVPYVANTLVMFLNGLDALHAVTPRQPVSRSRYFVNIVGEIAHPLFELKSRQRRFRQVRRLVARIGDVLRGRRRDSGQLRD